MNAFLGLVGLVILAAIVRWHRKLSAAIEPRDNVRVMRKRYPSISVIRPVRGKDIGAAGNFAAAALGAVLGDDGAPPAGRTGKLNAMVVGQRAAHGELIAFGDSDTRPDKHVLRETVDTLLASKENGSAFAPILVHQPAEGAGDVMYALMQNGLYAPLAAYASGERRELPFIMGQLMVFRRAALEAIGGVESVQGQLVDDMAIGKRVHEAGYKNVMGRHPLHIATGGLSLRQFLPVYGRWMQFSRNGLPTSFVWRQWVLGVGFYLALLTLLTALATGSLFAALFPAAALVAQAASMLMLQRKNGGAAVPAKWWVMPIVFFLVAPYVLAKNMLKKRVNWRGREYRLDAAAALAGRPLPVRPAPLSIPSRAA
jgi:ceramide glucosyltransferase